MFKFFTFYNDLVINSKYSLFQGIKEHYKIMCDKIQIIKKSYFDDCKKYPNYDFACNVHKLENFYDSVKKVDFILWQEAFIYIADNIRHLEEYRLALTPRL